MVYYREEFKTEAEALAYREALYTDYHPCGYGTYIKIEYDATKDRWVASGSRGSSCD